MTSRPLTIFASFPTVPFTDYLPSGDGLVAYHMIRQLSARGHTIHVATPRSELLHPVPERVTIHEMQWQGGLSRPRALPYMRWTRQILRKVRKSLHIDLIHELNPVFSLCSLAFAYSGLPVVLGPHSSRWPAANHGRMSAFQALRRYTKGAMKDLCLRRQHKDAAAVLLSTPAALNNVAEPESMKGKLYILPPGVDAEEFAPDPRSRTTSPTILFLANVSVRKGIYSLLDAFSQLIETVPDVRLIIAGDGPDLPAAKKRVAKEHWKNRVEFHGRVGHDNVAAMMNRCTVYCLPSQGEPFGMTAIEAMACGKPLVVTNAGGLAYMVSDKGGRRVEPGNSDALANALHDLLADPDLCLRMGEHNRSLIETTYAWPAVAARLEQIYFEVMDMQKRDNPDLVTEEVIRSYRNRGRMDVGAVPANAEAHL